MIRVRNHATTFLRFLCAALLLQASGILFAESVWEGSAAVGRYGEFPATGFYAATNAFPRNTALVVENLETGNTSSVIVVDRLSRPGLFMLLSRDAAGELGLADNDIAQVRVVVEEKSSGLPAVTEDDMAVSPDPDLNPAVSARGVEDLAFLESYVTGGVSEEEKEPEAVVEDEVVEEEVIDEETVEGEVAEEVVEEESPEPEMDTEETPPELTLTTEDVATRLPSEDEPVYSLTEIPEAPEAAKREALLTSFDSASLIAPPVRGVSTSVAAAPAPPEFVAEEPEEDLPPLPELLDITELPPVPYPPVRVVAAAFEAPEEPYFEAPEVEADVAGEEPAGPVIESFALVEPSEELPLTLSVAAVPEEPVFETEAPKATEYIAPPEMLYEMAWADVPEAPKPDVPEISGSYLASAGERADFEYADVPIPPEREEEVVEADRPETDLAFAEPEKADVPSDLEVVPEPEEEETVPEPEEEPVEELPAPGEIELFLEPAEMRPPEPIEEVAVEEEPVEEEPVEEEPVEDVALAEETEPEEETPVEDVALAEETEPEEETPVEVVVEAEETEPEEEPVVEEDVVVKPPEEEKPVREEPVTVETGRFTVAAELAPATHYLQLGVFSEESTARGAAARIGSGYPVTIQKTGADGSQRYKLFVGPLSPDESGALLYRFRTAGYRDAFVRVTN